LKNNSRLFAIDERIGGNIVSIHKATPFSLCLIALAFAASFAGLGELRGQTTNSAGLNGKRATAAPKQTSSSGTTRAPSGSAGSNSGSIQPNTGQTYTGPNGHYIRPQAATTGIVPQATANFIYSNIGSSTVLDTGSPASPAAIGPMFTDANAVAPVFSRSTSAGWAPAAEVGAGREAPVYGPLGPVTLGFDPVHVPPSAAGLAIANRLSRLPSLHFVTAVRVDIVGRTAVLRGAVASDHDRDLAERVVMLEASVDDVVNMLVVRNPSVPPPPLPAPPAPGASS